jgi:hypothetical protein
MFPLPSLVLDCQAAVRGEPRPRRGQVRLNIPTVDTKLDGRSTATIDAPENTLVREVSERTTGRK